MFRTALRNVFAHKARLLMTACAVMLGVTFISGSLVYGDTLHRAATARATDGYERIAVSVFPEEAPAAPAPAPTVAAVGPPASTPAP
ncbi:hypothetical protein WKI68_03955 [Streptomyces sp. MS1.HAVA.3]|uniref:ABC transporter permease n=1 Tax=Streptomyces caledonius TaxID=3134107 RepID=A0ABU8TYZ2_9ACTN